IAIQLQAFAVAVGAEQPQSRRGLRPTQVDVYAEVLRQRPARNHVTTRRNASRALTCRNPSRAVTRGNAGRAGRGRGAGNRTPSRRGRRKRSQVSNLEVFPAAVAGLISQPGLECVERRMDQPFQQGGVAVAGGGGVTAIDLVLTIHWSRLLELDPTPAR